MDTITNIHSSRPVPTQQLTKPEALVRLWHLTRMMREQGELPFGASFNLGVRVYRCTYDTIPDRAAMDTPDDDDLHDIGDYDYVLDHYGLHEGEVTEIWVYEWSRSELCHELHETRTVWMGTPDADPVIID